MAFFNFFKKKKNEPENINEPEEVKTSEQEETPSEETETSEQEEKPEEEEVSLPKYEDTSVIEEVMPEREKTAEETEAETAEEAEPEPEQQPQTEEPEEIPKKKKSFFAKIKSGLQKTRDNILSGVEQVLKGFTEIDDDLYEELEEALIMADIGVETSLEIISRVKDIVKKEKIKDVAKVRDVIVRVISDMLSADDEEFELPSPSIILVIGVNGVGKTTTIGKLTNYYKSEGKSVMLAAADTFRAAAIDQLMVWGERNDVTVIKHAENSDPAAVVFDAVSAAKNRKTDILICDTAGRLHNKKNLMEELNKISRVITRENENAHKEVFLVLDATTGQNALQQAKLFKEAADITGIILTKLDGTAKGGIIIAIKNELQIPVRFIGVGEGIDDLRPFNPSEFAKALFED
ncbi:MAG: signal recognition particle-docking protein FtsY [Clostridiales bacterium]|nr:signal recognition particle-docking protein FtsY [Clostridiales bacterium]